MNAIKTRWGGKVKGKGKGKDRIGEIRKQRNEGTSGN